MLRQRLRAAAERRLIRIRSRQAEQLAKLAADINTGIPELDHSKEYFKLTKDIAPVGTQVDTDRIGIGK